MSPYRKPGPLTDELKTRMLFLVRIYMPEVERHYPNHWA